MGGTILFSVIAICVTITKVMKAKFERDKDKIVHFHCPDCQKYYPGEWDNEPVPRYIMKVDNKGTVTTSKFSETDKPSARIKF